MVIRSSNVEIDLNIQAKLLCFCFFMAVWSPVLAQDTRYDSLYTNTDYAARWEKLSSDQKAQALRFTTPAYRQEALQLLLAEANHMAAALKLEKNLPITQSNIISGFVGPPLFEIKGQGIGFVTTTNYEYYIGWGGKGKMNRVVLTRCDEMQRLWREKYRWPRSKLNTQAALKLARQWLQAASVDIARLDREGQFCVEPVWLDENSTNYFAPIYYVTWNAPSHDKTEKLVAADVSVSLFLPQKRLIDMTIEEPKYILRDAVIVSNMDYMTNLLELLAQTNAPITTDGVSTNQNAMVSPTNAPPSEKIEVW